MISPDLTRNEPGRTTAAAGSGAQNHGTVFSLAESPSARDCYGQAPMTAGFGSQKTKAASGRN